MDPRAQLLGGRRASPASKGGGAQGEDQRPTWQVPGSPDYLAIRVAVSGAKCAWRADKKGKNKDKPDPYVRVLYDGRHWTGPVAENTVQPKWPQLTFEVPIAPDRRNAMGEMAVQLWDACGRQPALDPKPKPKHEHFLGEVRLPLGDFGGVNYEYVEPRRYPLRERGDKHKTDRVEGDIMLKIGMIMPKKASYKEQFPEGPNGERATQSLIAESEQVADDSYESVMRSLRLAENSKQTAVDTLDTLGKQGEQLRRIQEDLDDIGELQDKADRHMRAITSVGGAIANKFTKQKKRRDHLGKANRLQEKDINGREDVEEEDFDPYAATESKQSKHYRAKYSRGGEAKTGMYKEDFSHLSQGAQDKIKDTDKGLDRIGELLDDMKLLAIDMGDEIEDHNRRLAIIHKDVDVEADRMKITNRKIKDRL